MARAQPDACRGQSKKLAAIARAIYEQNQPAPGDGKDDLQNLPERVRERIARERGAATVDLWEEHVVALEVFQRCDTLWRVAPMGAVVGLDYAGVESLMRMMGIHSSGHLPLLDDLRVMESAAMKVINRSGGS